MLIKLFIPTLSLILILNVKKAWWVNFITLITLTLSATIYINSRTDTIITSYISLLDQIRSILIILSVLIAAIIILARRKIIYRKHLHKLFLLINVILLLTLLLCFSSISIIWFYIWFEASLIPTLLIILVWGYQPERIQAGIYLIIYTITASLPILLTFTLTTSSSTNIIYINSTISLPYFINTPLLSIFLVLGFLAKLPIFSMHLWLPKAHVEAPIAGSIILAAVLLKLGGFGLVRVITNMYTILIPKHCLLIISLYGAVVTSLICLRQPDIKSLIAYSSVGHIGIILAGMISFSSWGIIAALIIIIAHGLCSSALFIIANLSYTITHTRRIYLTKGILAISPTISIWWFLLLAVNIAAPPSLNLLREIILISSIIYTSSLISISLALLRFFTAAYSLHLFAITQHGQPALLSNPAPSYKIRDMLLLFTHITPLSLLILKSDIILSWI